MRSGADRSARGGRPSPWRAGLTCPGAARRGQGAGGRPSILNGRATLGARRRGRYETTIAGVGPRATPTIDGATVFTLGAIGRLNALDLETGGQALVARSLEEFGANAPEWGRRRRRWWSTAWWCQRRRRLGERLAGRFRPRRPARSSGRRAPTRVGYSSPTSARALAGRRQIVVFNRASVAGHEVADGRASCGAIRGRLVSPTWRCRWPWTATACWCRAATAREATLLRIEPEAEGLVARLELGEPAAQGEVHERRGP